MKFKFQGKRIDGILTVIPKQVRTFDEEMGNYTATNARMKRMKEVMGYGEHRIATLDTCVSDMAVFGAEQLFNRGIAAKGEIGAVLLVTDSPDYFLPPTSSVIHGRLGLSQDVYCLDMTQGCSGYIVGLLQAFQLLEQMEYKKVLLIVGTVGSRKVSPKDRKTYPLAGDAVSVSVIENCDEASAIYAEMRIDGSRADALMIPAGGYRKMSSAETVVEKVVDEFGNMRSDEQGYMRGGDVFNFVIREIPRDIKSTLALTEKTVDDFFLFGSNIPTLGSALKNC